MLPPLEQDDDNETRSMAYGGISYLRAEPFLLGSFYFVEGFGMTKNEALRMSLEALECALSDDRPYISQCKEAITTIKEVLAQPKQEDLSLEAVYKVIIQWDEGGGKRSRRELARRIVSRYAMPSQRKWVWLTEQEQGSIMEELNAHGTNLYHFAKAIEAKLKKKNQ